MPDSWKKVKSGLARYLVFGVQQTYCYEIRPENAISDLATHSDLTIAPMASDCLPVLREIWTVDLDEMRGRVERGDLCYVGHFRGRPAHYSWVQRSGMHEITDAGTRVAVAPGEFWIYHCRTAEFARGKGIYPATLARIVRDHFSQHYQRGHIYTERDNLASQRGIVKAGFTPESTLTAFCLGPWHVRWAGKGR